MKRSEGECLLKSLDGFLGNESRLLKVLARCDYSVANGTNLVHGFDAALFSINEERHDDLNGILVILEDDAFNDLLASVLLMLAEGSFDTDPVGISFGEHLFALHVDELVFEGRTSRIKYKYLHNFPCSLLIKTLCSILMFAP